MDACQDEIEDMANEMDGDGDMDAGGDDIGPEFTDQNLVIRFGRSDQIGKMVRYVDPW